MLTKIRYLPHKLNQIITCTHLDVFLLLLLYDKHLYCIKKKLHLCISCIYVYKLIHLLIELCYILSLGQQL